MPNERVVNAGGGPHDLSSDMELSLERAAKGPLLRLEAAHTIEAAYRAWDEVRAEHDARLRRFEAEERRIEEQGALLVGAVRFVGAVAPITAPSTSASSAPPIASTASSPAPLASTSLFENPEARLVEARHGVRARRDAALAAFAEVQSRIRTEVLARIQRQATHALPRARLRVHQLAADQRILHLVRPEPDELVTLFWALCLRIPSRYEAGTDDSTDDLQRAPATLYGEEGVTPQDVRAPAFDVRARLLTLEAVWPAKGALFQLLSIDGESRLVRWLCRGPVFEAEIEEGEGFRNILRQEDAERITGGLLELQVQGRLVLEFDAG
jgi:hypothetical protein